MALPAYIATPAEQGSTQFLVTVAPAEKRRWKTAADAAGVSMAEYVRRAVAQAADAPSAAEIAEARALAKQVSAAADRMGAMLDRTNARIEALLDPAVEAARRERVLSDLAHSGQRLDIGLLRA